MAPRPPRTALKVSRKVKKALVPEKRGVAEAGLVVNLSHPPSFEGQPDAPEI